MASMFAFASLPLIGPIIKGLIGKLAKANIDAMFAGISDRVMGKR